ncbi:MAG TPA: hypothetical protein PKX40_12630 [Spirochaetota bacterium]|nr:hypothetical protein [Spirochaetota bacterium]
MENSEPQLFQKAEPSSRNDPVDCLDPTQAKTEIMNPVTGDIDHHMIDIVAAYIRKLPDKNTRKHIARIMVNAIIKSADL